MSPPSNCRFERTDDGCCCQNPDCGRCIEWGGDCGGLRAMCRGEAKPGLGDHTERLLASLGITQERYKEAKRLFGLAPKCGCAERKAWLNRVGAWWRG